MPIEFIMIGCDTAYLLPASVQNYLPEGQLARFVVEMVDQLALDMGALLDLYAFKGKKSYYPAMQRTHLPVVSWREPPMTRLLISIFTNLTATMTPSRVSANVS